MAEIAGLAMESFAEVPLPEPVHRHSGEQGIVGRGEPVGEGFDAPFSEVDGAAHERPSRVDRPICFGPARIGAGQYVALFTGPIWVGLNGVEDGEDGGIGAPNCLRQVVDPASQLAVFLAEVFGEYLVDLVAINSEDGKVIVGDLLFFDAASAFRLADHRLNFWREHGDAVVVKFAPNGLQQRVPFAFERGPLALEFGLCLACGHEVGRRCQRHLAEDQRVEERLHGVIVGL